MKKILNQAKSNILLCDFFFVGMNVLLHFTLYLFNMRFRLWFLILIALISIIGFVVGLFQQIFCSTKNKKAVIIISLLGTIPIILLITVLMPIIGLVAAFNYRPEHIVTLDNQKYVAVVNSFLHVDVDYYDYYGPLLMGTKVRVHGYFGRGGFDPFVSTNIVKEVEYTYYDKNGKIKSKKNVTFKKDQDGNIVGANSYDVDIDSSSKFNPNDDYLLPEMEEVLYEKKFNKTILRFGKVDNVLGQNILVNVLRSTDNGQNFYVVSDDVIQVSNQAQFVFLDEKLGFAISTGQIYLDNRKIGLYVTTDSGKTFVSANFNYKNENVDYISIEDVPYYDNDILKIKCSVYQMNTNGNSYEDRELIFISHDNGISWILEDN